ncbi:MAG: DnaK suppressor protein [Pseudohongiellaceae bacterium]|jgi:DnaK suppressor protein
MLDLTPEEKTQLKTQLQQMVFELEQQIGLSENSTTVVTLDQSAVGRVSRVDALQQQSMALSLQRSAQQNLRQVKVALGSIERDCFGYCQHCDEPIAFARLQIQPATRFCLKCQSEADSL